MVLQQIEKLVERDELADALALCREQLALNPDSFEWQLQLGLLLFLDEKNETWYTETVPALREAVMRDQTSAVAHFWYGYALTIIDFDDRESELQTRRCLQLEPNHLYANIFLAGGLAGPEESIVALRRALDVQPSNRRALVRMAEKLIELGRSAEAKPYLLQALNTEPYVEHRYGIMNGYLSGVLCGVGTPFTSALAQELLKQIEDA